MVQYQTVDGYPNYCVGDDGSVWSCASGVWVRKKQSFINGRPVVILSRNRRCVTRGVHRLILEAFIGPCPSGMMCCHWDGDKTNNQLTNLRWGTAKENQADRRRHGTTNIGESHPNAKLTEYQVYEIRRLAAVGCKYIKIAQTFGVDPSTVGQIVLRRCWSHI